MGSDGGYRMAHQPIEGADPLHDLGSVGAVPSDVYAHPEWYAWGESQHVAQIAAVLRAVRGRADALVTIYRAVPVGITVIETGNWVSLTAEYAQQHAAVSDDPADDMPVVAARVPARYVCTGGGDIIEWGYWGPPVDARKI